MRVVFRLVLATAAVALALSAQNLGFDQQAAQIIDARLKMEYAKCEQLAEALVAEPQPSSLHTAEALELLAGAKISMGESVDSIGDLLTQSANTLGPDPGLPLSRNLRLRAELEAAKGNFAPAARMLEQVAQLEEQFNAPSRDRALTAADLAQTYNSAGRYKDASEQARLELKIAQAAEGEQSFLAARARLDLGQTLIEISPADSRKELDTALARFTALLGPDCPLAGRTLVYIGTVEYHLSRYVDANAFLDRGLTILEHSLPPNHKSLVAPLNNYALCSKQLGNYSAAEEAFNRALDISVLRFGPEHTSTATLLNNLGILKAEIGDYPAALRMYQRSLAIQEKRLGPDNDMVGSVLYSMSALHRWLNDYAQADAESARALSIHEKALGPTNWKTVQTLRSRVELAREMKHPEEARKLAEEALARTIESAGAQSEVAGSAERSLSGALADLGEYGQAKSHLEKAIPLLRGTILESEALSDLGNIASKQGQHEKAVELQNQAVALRAAFGGPSSQGLANTVLREAGALADAGRREEAIDAALESARLREESLRLVARASVERLALNYTSQAEGGIELALTLMRTEPEYRRVWNRIALGRNMILDETAARSAAWRRASSKEGALGWQQLASARAQLASLALREASSDKSLAKEMRVARAEEERLEQELASKNGEFKADLAREHSGLSEVLRGLPERTSLVAYVAKEHYYAFVNSGATVKAFDLGSAHDVDALVSAWRKEIEREKESFGRKRAANERSYIVAATALRKAVWDPVASSLVTQKQIFIVPDGRLQEINFDALPSAASGYLAERGPLLHLLNAEREVLLPPSGSHRRSMLAVGEPAFDVSPSTPSVQISTAFRGATPACAGTPPLHFDPLPSSGEEARRVANFARTQGWQVELLSGAAAGEANLKDKVHGQQVVHFATHGFFLDHDCEPSGSGYDTALLHSGLALAGANHRARTGAEDGILTAEEAASLDLGGTEWVVLSGCDTATGELLNGEGVLGLRRAFEVAGARTQIASLWAVRDDDTSQWMSSLYGARFSLHLSTLEAVARANRQELARRRAAGLSTHPFHWASFVAAGDWR
jgi:CHAT domain-containing protein